MIIRHVRLSNIRSYTDALVEFPTGSVMLSGDIGSGKSTILLAIEFCLFGITAALDGTALLRNGKNSGSVELKMAIDGNDVIIKRSLKRFRDAVRQDSGYMIIHGQKHELAPVELKARTLELLGYPKELLTKSKSLIYRYTVYTPQEEMRLILMDSNTSRLDTLRKVFQIDKYRRIKENSQLLIKEIKEKMRELSAKAEDLPQKQESARELEKELIDAGTKVSGLLPMISQLEALVMQKKAHAESLEGKSRLHAEHRKKLEIALSRIREKERVAKEAEADIARAGTEIAVLQNRQETAAALHSPFVQKLAAARKWHISTESEVAGKPAAKQRLLEAENELGRINAEIRKLQFITESSRKLAQGIAALTMCPTCRQPVSSGHKEHIRQTEEEKTAGANAEMEKHAADKKLHEEKAASLRTEIDKLHEKERQLANAGGEIAACGETAAELGMAEKLQEAILTAAEPETNAAAAAAIAELRAMNRQIRESMHYSEMLADKQRVSVSLREKMQLLGKETETLSREAEEEKKFVSELSGVDVQITAAKAELEDLLRQEKALLMQKAALMAEKEGISRNIKSLQQEIEGKLRIKAGLEDEKKLVYWLDAHFISLAEAIERQVMLRIYNEFNTFFQNWFSVLMQDEAISVRLNEEFSPVIEQNGYELSFDSLSGGERTSCALAYRLALNKAINDLVTTIKTRDIIILDEPTDGFSSEQIERIRDVAEQLSIAQIIIVSHEAKIESFVDSVIRIVKEEHVSRVQ
ncbi:SMC family ATPase [Candidatus Woesearchaeota archaeon]|nr:SMC family ATPase [Candidatus Woesearchaeota archaeon]